MEWQEISMWEAVEFMSRRSARSTISGIYDHGGEHSASGILFDDGTKVVCESRWSGPYSELTPDVDVDGEAPVFYVFARPLPRA